MRIEGDILSDLSISPQWGKGEDHFYLNKRLEFSVFVSGSPIEALNGYFRDVVEKGFETDLASVPRLLQGYIRRDGPHINEAVLHDWLYVEQRLCGIWLPRGFVDKLFYEMLKANPEISNLRAWIMYKAVRLGGGRMYRKRAHRIGNQIYDY